MSLLRRPGGLSSLYSQAQSLMFSLIVGMGFSPGLRRHGFPVQ
jgi:hypothetical protein